MSDIFRRRGRAEEDKEGKIMRYDFLNTLKKFSDASIEQQKCLYGLVEAIGEAVILTHFEQLPALADAEKENNELIKQLTCKVDALFGKVETLENELQRKNNEDASAGRKIDIANSNLKDLRDLHGQICRKMQELSTDSVDEFVMRPMIKDLSCVYESLRRKRMNNDSAEINESLEQFKILLESYEVTIIEPNERNKFNPSEHTPVKKYGVASKYLDKTVKNTVCTGIKYKGKVIKPALVEVLYFKPEKHKEGSDE